MWDELKRRLERKIEFYDDSDAWELEREITNDILKEMQEIEGEKMKVYEVWVEDEDYFGVDDDCE